MRKEAVERQAVLYASQPPSPEQEQRFARFLEDRYGETIPLVWQKSWAFPRGFRLVVGTDSYDWSLDGRFRQLRTALAQLDGQGRTSSLLSRKPSNPGPPR